METHVADDQSFLGRGWAFPPTFSLRGADVEMVSGADDVEQSLQILLATAPGELFPVIRLAPEPRPFS
jgi:hypothetical protein